MTERRLYLAAYDVTDTRRLRLALHCVRSYATGGQRSVHECWLTDAERSELIEDTSEILDPEEDRFLLVRLDPRQPVTALGKAVAPEDPQWYYVG